MHISPKEYCQLHYTKQCKTSILLETLLTSSQTEEKSIAGVNSLFFLQFKKKKQDKTVVHYEKKLPAGFMQQIKLVHR